MSSLSHLPASYVPFAPAFYAAAEADPDGLHAWAVTLDESLAFLESDDCEAYAAAVAEFLDKAERRGAISAALARSLADLFD